MIRLLQTQCSIREKFNCRCFVIIEITINVDTVFAINNHVWCFFG